MIFDSRPPGSIIFAVTLHSPFDSADAMGRRRRYRKGISRQGEDVFRAEGCGIFTQFARPTHKFLTIGRLHVSGSRRHRARAVTELKNTCYELKNHFSRSGMGGFRLLGRGSRWASSAPARRCAASSRSAGTRRRARTAFPHPSAPCAGGDEPDARPTEASFGFGNRNEREAPQDFDAGARGETGAHAPPATWQGKRAART